MLRQLDYIRGLVCGNNSGSSISALSAGFVVLALSSLGVAQTVSGSGTGGTLPVWTGNGTVSVVGNSSSSNPSPWIDVKANGAQGNAKTVTDAASGTPLTHLTSATANWTSADVGKAISVDVSLFPPPALAGIISSTSSCLGTPGINTSQGPLGAYYRIAYVGSVGPAGNPSVEGYLTIPKSASMSCVIVSSPSTFTGATKYQVYIAFDTAAGVPGAASGTEVQAPGSTNCTGGTPLLGNTCEVDAPPTPNSNAITSATRSSGISAIVTSGTAAYSVGQWVRISGVGPEVSFNGTWQVSTAGTGSFSFKQLNLPATTTASSGGLATTSIPHGAQVLLTSISSLVSSSEIILSAALPNSFTQKTASWGTDDTTTINNIITSGACSAASTTGCKLYFPPGEYWIQGSGITIGQNQSFFYLMGAGASNSKAVGPHSSGQTIATSELVTADQTYPLTIGTPGGSAINSGPRISNLGFRDVSGTGNALGGIHLTTVAHAFLDDLSFADFIYGTGVYFDAGGGFFSTPSPANQYNFILDPTAINVRTPFQFSTGQNASNWIIGGNLAGSEVGGGACVDFQSNSGASSGGNNYLFYPQCNFFPLAIHIFDQNSNRIFFHTENTDGSTNGVIGSPGSGTAVLVEGTSPSFCEDNHISNSSVTSLAQGFYIASNCTRTVITSPSFEGVTTHVTDLGSNSQTVGAAPDVQNVAFSGLGNSLMEYFTSAGVTAGDIVCFTGATTTVGKCTTGANNPLGVALSTVASGGGAVVGVQVTGLANVTIASHSLSPGQFVCLLATNAGFGSVQTTPCSLGLQVGIVAQSSGGSSVTTALTFLQKN